MTPWAMLQYVDIVEPIGDAFTDWEAYASAWENSAAKLMPVGHDDEYKMRYWMAGAPTPGFYMQISTPTFSPDATSVPAPVSFELFTTGRRSIDVRTA